jgi:hypothetical protein
MNKLYTATQVSKALANRLRSREWRLENCINKEELVHHVENLSNCLNAVKEILKESVL